MAKRTLFVEKSINISGGGIGMTVDAPYQPNDTLTLTLQLPDQSVFTSPIEVLRLNPLTAGGYRLHAHNETHHAKPRVADQAHHRFQRSNLQEALFGLSRRPVTRLWVQGRP
ncbi:MAG: PilZ domain-containing protein [Nitrospiraceae bacterium]